MDAHRLVQLAGPRLRIKGHMMMGQSQTIMFKQPGLYRFKTKVVEMGPRWRSRQSAPTTRYG